MGGKYKDLEKRNTLSRKLWKKYKEREPRKSFLYRAKSRSNASGLDFNLELEDIVIPELCPILKIPLEFNEGKVNSNSPTLDRIINDKGYVKGNVAIISNRANRLKSNITIDQARNLVEYMEKAL